MDDLAVFPPPLRAVLAPEIRAKWDQLMQLIERQKLPPPGPEVGLTEPSTTQNLK